MSPRHVAGIYSSLQECIFLFCSWKQTGQEEAVIWPTSLIFHVTIVYLYVSLFFFYKAAGYPWLWPVCLFQVYLNTIHISFSLSRVTRPENPVAVVGYVLQKMPVAQFLLDFISLEKFTFLSYDHMVQVLLKKTRMYLQVNLNEPRRDSRRGSFLGQLGGVMWEDLLDPCLHFVESCTGNSLWKYLDFTNGVARINFH